jgi:hypothetical protein
MLALMLMLAMPLIVGVAGPPYSLLRPDRKPLLALARVFVACLTVSGVYQTLFFRKYPEAAIILFCGASMVYWMTR